MIARTKLLPRTRRLPVRHFAVALLVVATALALNANAAELSALASALETITADQLKEHTDTLADDSFEGREGGSRGGKATANYLMTRLEGYGLSPGGKSGSYFQSFGSYRNVLAVLPGSDEQLKEEYIILGAHFDHVGYGTRKNAYGAGFIHNGADDNASGTAALLEVAQAFAEMEVAPRRSILFAFWDAEEKGLLGSKHWVANPTVPLDKVRLKINADMVGRMEDEKVIVYGTRTAPGLRRIVAEANQGIDLNVSYVWWINPRSDHYTFVKKQVPVLMLHTGLHKDYHRPSDDAHRLNIDGLQRTSKLLFSTAHDLANRDDVPRWRKEAAWESTSHRKTFESAPAASPPRLGVSWESVAEQGEESGLLVKGVSQGSSAEAAGVLPGDRITAFNGRAINSGEELRAQVLASPQDVEIVVRRKSSDEPITLKAKLPGQPVQLGISWRENSAEPGAVTVVKVIEGSPAYAAGIRRLDRIYAVDGERFANSDAFEKVVLPKNRTVRFLLERAGRLFAVEVKPNLLAGDSPETRQE